LAKCRQGLSEIERGRGGRGANETLMRRKRRLKGERKRSHTAKPAFSEGGGPGKKRWKGWKHILGRTT